MLSKGKGENENKSVEGRDINLDLRSASPLRRKGHGSHPISGPDLIQREEQREKVGAIPCGCPQFRSKYNSFVNNHLLDPNILLGGR